MNHIPDIRLIGLDTICLFLLSIAISLAAGWLVSAFCKKRWTPKNKIWEKIAKSRAPFLFPALIFLGLISPLLIFHLEIPIFLLRIGFSIFAGLTLHSLLFSLTKNSLLRVMGAVILWSLVGLEASGILLQALQFLSETKVKIGTNNFSILSLLKALLFTLLLIWGASATSDYFEKKMARVDGLLLSRKLLIAKLVRVLLIILALYIGLSASGIDLSILTFFAGALGVGAAFGLQNIFSNFFAGIIILFDRSVKPGDIISIDNGKIYGVVNKLRSRYVSIHTDEGKEHLVPNEQIISNKLENWSFTDSNIQIETTFTISGESDLKVVEQVLLGIAKSTERILEIPPPSIEFVSLSRNVLELKLCTWIGDPQKGIGEVRSSIIRQAYFVFKEKGITTS